MDYDRKQNISGIVCLLSTVFVLFCMWKIIPYGLVGDTAKVKRYAAIGAPAVVIGLGAGIAYYYYRSKDDFSTASKAGIEVAALSEAVKKTPKMK